MAAMFDVLPEELTLSIVEHLEADLQALRNLALTCKRFQALSEPLLYDSLFLRHGHHSASLRRALQARPSRGVAIRSINARLLPDANHIAIDNIDQVIRHATRLKEYILESPYCNGGRWRLAAAKAPWASSMSKLLLAIVEATELSADHLHNTTGPRPLQQLTNLTLHLNGEGREFWTVHGIYGFIFAHPNLKTLHLSSANLPRDTTELIPHGTKTPLRHLTLDECNITMEALSSVLALPLELQYLYIGENEHSPDEVHFPAAQAYNHLCEKQPQAFFAALAQQQHSLQTLVYNTVDIPNWFSYLVHLGPSTAALADPTLKDFSQLRVVRMPHPSKTLVRLLTSDLTAPPGLSTLSIEWLGYEQLFGHDADERPISITGVRVPTIIQNAVSAMPQLAQLQLTFDCIEYYGPDLEDRPDWNIVAAGDFLARHGVTLRILQPNERSSIVRPILYGEEETEDFLLYVNDDVGFRHVSEMSEWSSFEDSQSDDDDDDDDDEEVL
ncbi:hypothetical protein LTR85_003499 [Meristemomyces frigidus]|nr:hypothetical protein LTR85_003499 [Meristemomyces frigidus]